MACPSDLAEPSPPPPPPTSIPPPPAPRAPPPPTPLKSTVHHCQADQIFATLIMKWGLCKYYNKSTQRLHTSAKTASYSHIAKIRDSESQHGDPNHPHSLISCSLYHSRAVLKLSSYFAYNLLSNSDISN